MQFGKRASALWIAAGCVAAYGVTLAGGFVYDDLWTVVHNPFISDPANLWRLLTGELPADLPDGPRPFAVATAFLDYSVWGLRPFGWHLQSLLWHLACALGVAALARGLAGDERVALAAGLLFGVHAIHSEAVAAINYREDLIVTAALVYALLCVRRGRASAGDGWSRGAGWIGLACGLLLLGTNAKETVVLFPALLLLHDLCFRQGVFAEPAERWLWPYLLLLLACFGSRFWLSVLSGSAPLAHTAGARALEPMPLLFTEAGITLAYVGQLLLPVGLSAEYMTPVSEQLDASAAAGLMLVGSLAAVGLWNLRRRPLIGFGLLWFLVALLPTANIVPIENLRADRYLYLPAVGFCLAAACCLLALAGWLASGRRNADRVFAGLLACLCLVYAGLAFQRSRVWRDDLTLWQYTAARVPGSLRAQLGLMSAYQRAGRLDEALQVGREAARMSPTDWKLHLNLGLIHSQQQRPELALEELTQAAQQGGEGRPELADALAAAHFQAGRPERAVRVLEAGLERSPDEPRLVLALGKIEFAQAHYRAAVVSLERAAELYPREVEPLRLLAKTRLRLGEPEAALQAARRARELDPADPRGAALVERVEQSIAGGAP